MKGFTLIEILLVLVIVSVIILASINYMRQRALQMRMDRASTQIQQILNAGLAFYVANGKWPTNLATDLQGTYLPNVTFNNPWGKPYQIAAPTPQLFYVYTQITTVSSGGASAAANIIAGMLPLGYTSTSGGTPPATGSSCGAGVNSCYVVSSVNIPGQNLNNARAVNFAGLYHHGGCVPVPTCPVDSSGNTMIPQVMVVPASVSGVNDADSTPSNVYPISSFTAYATGGTSSSPPACQSSSSAPACGGTDPAGTRYWRACLQVITEKGQVTSATPAWGQLVTLMAVTRCSVNNEAAGSTFSVFSN
jgi:prepilin-type N-terminal cleavage/methylation domain-containing protein